MRIAWGLLLLTLALGGCRQQAPKAVVGWRPIASFSGRGDSQTESFNIESGQWRIQWATTNENPEGMGTFTVTVHSAVSGRPLGTPIEHKGNGRGQAYVNEDPRLYHLTIDSSHVDWSIAIEEAVAGYAAAVR